MTESERRSCKIAGWVILVSGVLTGLGLLVLAVLP